MSALLALDRFRRKCSYPKYLPRSIFAFGAARNI
jgi:hypothetical protein